MALPAYDNFNRANGAPGANWSGSVGGDLTITSQQIGGASSFVDNSMYWSADTPDNDQYAQLKMVNPDVGEFTGPFVRGSATDWVFLDGYGTGYDIEWYNSNSWTVIGSLYGTAPANGDISRIEAEGTEFRGYVNGGVAKITGSNGSAPASGRGGIYIYDSDPPGRADDFEVGNLAAADPAPSVSDNLTVADSSTLAVSDPTFSASDNLTVTDDPTVSIQSSSDTILVNISPSANYIQVVTP